ncbi:molybdopterin-dependent oxidoreductase [Roseomonas sp. HJA6]|uniref:Molybdopterin-dependent oxidoreductase n=1 Tax=Roseomonas alba TaxID=2846776 RepID=A0ABS7A294_9PROT|nr:molybdopterin-dependent oxidoreductase [Neoroseomonas alba]MBW6396400.1 molybdopterin-dependent oxidoreductase [Neoroseomonas alba]
METVRVVCAHDCPDMCSLLVQVEEGRVRRVAGDPEHPYTAGFACAKVNRDAELVHAPGRLATPLRRTGPKGSGQFAPIGWDAALDEIETRWKAIIAESGPLALLGYAYSAHQGQINRHLPNGLFHALGSSRLQAGTVCDSCCETAWDMTLGPVGGADPESVIDSDLIIAWGCDLMAVNVHFLAKLDAPRKRGVKVIVIDPRRSRTAQQADWHLPIRIGTDAALAIGIAHILARDGLLDRDYIDANTLGFDRWATEVLPRFPPERVAEITGLAVADIEKLAALYGAAKRSFIRVGEGMTRIMRGGQALRAVVTLPALTGAYGRPGGGALLLTAGSMDFDFSFVRKPMGSAATRAVNQSLLGRALLEMRDPPIRALFVAANNPAVTCPDAARVRQGLAREDLFTVVHDPFMTDTALHADIVLPATTYLETADFYRGYGSYYMQFASAAVPPQGEAWSNVRLAQELARRMGVDHPVFTMTEQAIMKEFFRGAAGPVAEVDPDRLLDHRPVKAAPPPGQTFRTPSGRLEIFSATLEAEGVSPMPDWMPDETEVKDAATWPLRLLTAPSYFQPHTAFAGVGFLREREGRPHCVLHPQDAARRQLTDGQVVRLFNDHGAIRLHLRVSEDVRPGICLVPGQRPASEAVEGTVNMLCSDRLSDIGAGATYQSTFLEVEAAA